MKWKSKLAIAIVFVLAAVAVSVSALAAGAGRGEEVPPSYAHVSEVEESADGYIVRDYNGYIAVYGSASSDWPAVITDIEVSGLRDVDQKMLKNGIKVLNREELMLLLEDLGS